MWEKTPVAASSVNTKLRNKKKEALQFFLSTLTLCFLSSLHLPLSFFLVVVASNSCYINVCRCVCTLYIFNSNTNHYAAKKKVRIATPFLCFSFCFLILKFHLYVTFFIFEIIVTLKALGCSLNGCLLVYLRKNQRQLTFFLFVCYFSFSIACASL